jgi:hypothetical protein
MEIYKISGHHLHPPAAIDFKKIKESDLVRIVSYYDTFCEEVCGMDCDYQDTIKGRKIWEADEAIAKHYGFEIKRDYTVEEFLEKILTITDEKALEGSWISADYFGVM